MVEREIGTRIDAGNIIETDVLEDVFGIIRVDDDAIGKEELFPLLHSVEVLTQGGNGLNGLAVRRSAEEIDEGSVLTGRREEIVRDIVFSAEAAERSEETKLFREIQLILGIARNLGDMCGKIREPDRCSQDTDMVLVHGFCQEVGEVF